MDINYNEETDSGYIQVKYPKGIRSIESKDGLFNFDYDTEGELVGIEFLSLKELVRILEASVDLELE